MPILPVWEEEAVSATSLLDTPQATALLDEATLSAEDVASCEGRLAVGYGFCRLPLDVTEEAAHNDAGVDALLLAVE